MKRIITAATVLCIALSAFTACNDSVERKLYEGPEYVMFQDTLTETYVSQKHNTVLVPIATTKAVDFDRTFGVEVIAKGSTAIEDQHFRLKSHNVTIKAGERSTNVEIESNIDGFGKLDSLGTVLRLVIPESITWELYGVQTKVSLSKYCDQNMDTWFENEKAASDPEKYNYANYILHATFPFADSDTQFTKVLVKVVRNPLDQSQMIIKSPFQEGRDLKISLIGDSPEDNTIKILPQRTFFGLNTLWVTMRSNHTYSESSFNTCKRYMELYIESYIEEVTSFGIYPYYLEWITESRAEDIRNTGF